MPELPEVETACRGIAPHITGAKVERVIVRERRLRWPIEKDFEKKITGRSLIRISRRAKYLQLEFDNGVVLLHLGMSGHVRVIPPTTPLLKHDHVDIVFDNGTCLRFNDPRRFGSLHWTADPASHPLLAALGPEPLSDVFNGDYLFVASRKRKLAVKLFIMNSHIVVGVGNIYASEALFLAGIRPGRAAGRVTRAEYDQLAKAIKRVLQRAIRKGGTTLRDFTQPDGSSGYFSIDLNVYGRADEPCKLCGKPVKHKVMGQRATYWCSNCQR